MLRLSIIGCGLIGEKRARALQSALLTDKAKLVSVYDVNSDKAAKLASTFGCEAETQMEALAARQDTDAVIVCTTNNAMAPATLLCLQNGKHVFAEKPAGRNTDELRGMRRAALEMNRVLSVGFNHRFHPALQKAKKLLDSDAAGPLMYIRARYGHGARVGYEKEWRGNPELSGGGELLDQGVHLIDLSRWYCGSLNLAFGRVETFFWEMPVEDNGFLLLQSPEGKARAFLHASCTEWKNLFDFEIFGRTGKLQISGLGRSYGEEQLTFYKMKPEMGPPDKELWNYPGEDTSWELELDAFVQTVAGKAHPDLATIQDAIEAVSIVEAAYAASRPLRGPHL